jgi:hypothetical protein
MPSEIDDAFLDQLLARAGLVATPEQRAGLKLQSARVAAMAQSVRTPRSPLDELAHGFGFNEEDLG